MLIVSIGEIQYRTCLSTLSATFDDQRFSVRPRFPFCESVFYLSFIHNNTFRGDFLCDITLFGATFLCDVTLFMATFLCDVTLFWATFPCKDTFFGVTFQLKAKKTPETPRNLVYINNPGASIYPSFIVELYDSAVSFRHTISPFRHAQPPLRQNVLSSTPSCRPFCVYLPL